MTVSWSSSRISVPAGTFSRMSSPDAPVRCAPPQNKPTPQEKQTCAPWLDADLARSAPFVRSIMCLGAIGWDATIAGVRHAGWEVPRPKPKFGHGARAVVGGKRGDGPGDFFEPTLLLDVDPRNFPKGRDSLAELVADRAAFEAELRTRARRMRGHLGLASDW